MSGYRCHGCNKPLEKTWTGGHAPKWCSGRCRKASYGDPCVDCGARTAFGAERPRVPEPRCQSCALELRTIWSPDLILDRIREWADLHGEPPAIPDWSPINARQMHDEDRARRFEDADGHWPWFTLVVRVFGSWNTAIEAAGFTPRASHGGEGNVARRRSMRARAAA